MFELRETKIIGRQTIAFILLSIKVFKEYNKRSLVKFIGKIIQKNSL